MQADLYRERPSEAWGGIQRDWPGLVRSKLLMAQFMRVEIRHLRARAALALASQVATQGNHSQAQQLRRAALADAQTIERDRVAPAMPLAESIRAGAAGERREDAIGHLERARAGFRAAGMMLYEQAVSARLGTLRGGQGGAELRAEAHRWMMQNHVEQPGSMIAMLVPGV
ncbi:MAG TPA: hypothetical protein VLT33_38780 [Labilithrix sp.]|nr:hypothetical protein [Labilithrix sp.]